LALWKTAPKIILLQNKLKKIQYPAKLLMHQQNKLPDMKPFATLILFFLCLWQAFPAPGGLSQSPDSKTDTLLLSLEDARRYAVEHSTAMKTARTDQEIARRSIWEITAAGLPQVDGSIGYQYFIDIPTQLIPAEFFGGQPGEFQEIQFGTEHNLTASATVSQLVFDGSYIVGLRTARIYRQLADKNLLRTELDVKNTVTETYLLVLVARENLDILKQNLANLERTLFETRKLSEAGFTDPINVDQLRLAVSNLKNNISNLERQHRLTADLLKFQIGLDMSREVALTESLEGLFESISLQASLDGVFDPENHIDLQAMRTQEAFDQMVVRREQSAFLPNINASFTRQEMAMRNEFSFLDGEKPWFPTTIFAVNMNIPIFSSGLRSTRVQKAKLELEKTKLAAHQVSEGLKMQMNQARSSYSSALEKYQNEQESLALAHRILERTTIMHREGLSSSLELTQANDQLLATQANYLNALFELLNAKNNLEKALGKY
jgi:outer membrane protein